MKLVDFEKITVEFKCPECDDKVEANLANILEVGNPWCSDCDCSYEAAGSTAAIEVASDTATISRSKLISILCEYDITDRDCEFVADRVIPR
jgi:hypothetical protein